MNNVDLPKLVDCVQKKSRRHVPRLLVSMLHDSRWNDSGRNSVEILPVNKRACQLRPSGAIPRRNAAKTRTATTDDGIFVNN